jgi:glyoxylase-like metal-dependent hydrolase (beta-lactamase superfamily II)
MVRETFPVGPLACNCTVLGDETSGEAIVIDPGDDLAQILAVLARHHLTARQIVVTHGHIDHIGGALRLKQATGAPVFYNQKDLPLVAMMEEQAAWLGMAPPAVAPPDEDAAEGLVIGLSAEPAHVLHTPGHSEGSICLYLPSQKLLLAGDTLFAGSIGRTDLPGGDPEAMVRTLRERVLPLADETVVLPGHGPRTTIGRERAANPFLRGLLPADEEGR